MIVTKVSEVSKEKCKVEIDHEFAFVLYKGELRTYRIKVDEEISAETYQVIMDEVLTKRAKLRCMNLLKSRDYTKYQLASKLRQSLYPEGIIEIALNYVESYHYIDDQRYAESYIRYASQTKSRKQIEQDLLRKGVCKEIIEESFEMQGENEDTENELIRRLIEKKHYDSVNATYEETQKVVAYLYRKGFTIEKIYHVIGKKD